MMTRVSRETLDNKIGELDAQVLILANAVQGAILASVSALVEGDIAAAKNIYQEDQVINRLRLEIERQALITVATQQPLATDLRVLSSIIDVAGELERIGDYAKGIARIVIRLDLHPPLRQLSEIPSMARLTADMLQRAIGAFLARAEDKARSIPGEDDQVDHLYNRVYQRLLALMTADRDRIDTATFYLWIAHNLERAADRVTNICERTVFSATGELLEFDRSDDEQADF